MDGHRQEELAALTQRTAAMLELVNPPNTIFIVSFVDSTPGHTSHGSSLASNADSKEELASILDNAACALSTRPRGAVTTYCLN